MLNSKFFILAILVSTSLLMIGCAENPKGYVKRYADFECKQMHGLGKITMVQLRECRMTGQYK